MVKDSILFVVLTAQQTLPGNELPLARDFIANMLVIDMAMVIGLTVPVA